MIVVDTSFVVALLSASDRNHERAARWYGSIDAPFTTTPLVLAEIDYFAGGFAGAAARDAFRRDVAGGTYVFAWWPEAAAESVKVAEGYSDLGISLADASLVSLASRVGTTEIATFDERHFRAMRPLSQGTSFRILPADA